VRQLATIKDVVTEDDLVAMDEGGLSGEETEDQDDVAVSFLAARVLAANALAAMGNQ